MAMLEYIDRNGLNKDVRSRKAIGLDYFVDDIELTNRTNNANSIDSDSQIKQRER